VINGDQSQYPGRTCGKLVNTCTLSLTLRQPQVAATPLMLKRQIITSYKWASRLLTAKKKIFKLHSPGVHDHEVTRLKLSSLCNCCGWCSEGLVGIPSTSAGLNPGTEVRVLSG